MRISRISGPLLLLIATRLAFASEQESAARSAASTGWSWISMASAVTLVAAALALAFGVRMIFFRRRQGSQNNPRQLLHELCAAHGLSRRAEGLIKKAGAALNMPHVGRFFLEPQLLLQAQKCEQLRGHKRALGLLYNQLFGDDAE